MTPAPPRAPTKGEQIVALNTRWTRPGLWAANSDCRRLADAIDAALAEKDAEIERLKGLLVDAFAEGRAAAAKEARDA